MSRDLYRKLYDALVEKGMLFRCPEEGGHPDQGDWYLTSGNIIRVYPRHHESVSVSCYNQYAWNDVFNFKTASQLETVVQALVCKYPPPPPDPFTVWDFILSGP